MQGTGLNPQYAKEKEENFCIYNHIFLETAPFKIEYNK
jgi:hypothetical protein